jgi:hypothetical protein
MQNVIGIRTLRRGVNEALLRVARGETIVLVRRWGSPTRARGAPLPDTASGAMSGWGAPPQYRPSRCVGPDYVRRMATPSMMTFLPLEVTTIFKVPLLTAVKVATVKSFLFVVLVALRLIVLRSVEPQ